MTSKCLYLRQSEKSGHNPYLKTKKGQMMEVPFQLIFSLMLIAMFIFAAFYGIRYFLQRGEQVQMVQFLSEIREKVNGAWQTTESMQTYSFTLPKGIQKVCFANLDALPYDKSSCPEFETYGEIAKRAGSNLFFCPPEGAYNLGAPVYAKIDCEGTTCLSFLKNPYCIQNTGTVKITLQKRLGTANVILS